MNRVLLYTDEPILALGAASVLEGSGRFQLVETVSDLSTLPHKAADLNPDVLLADFKPAVTLDLLTTVRNRASRSHLVLWAREIGTELAFQTMGLGVRGILRHNLAPETLLLGLERVQAGEMWFEKSLTDNIMAANRVVLTRREGQLVQLLSHGMKNKEIALRLDISEGTVKVYLSRLFEKTGVKDRFELALFGLRNLAAGQTAQRRHETLTEAQHVPSLRSMMLRPAAPRQFG